MTGTEHTIISIATLFISFVIGRTIGKQQGYSQGVKDGIESLLISMANLYDVHLKADVNIVKERENSK